MTTFALLSGLFAVGMFAVAYGTYAKNGFGINTAPVSCPRCGSTLPQFRQPSSLRQALWGGGTCLSCGTEVDKWGGELPTTSRKRPAGRAYSTEEMRSRVKRRLTIFMPPVYFGLILLMDWPGRSAGAWMAAAVETAVFTVVFSFVCMKLFDRFSDATAQSQQQGSK
ncbi:MAG TPA: hypothetical protein VJN96_22240 [Vicinamibacterales bacterium]|nr:hypothetical protein [Vicinamibacterales bacterium]